MNTLIMLDSLKRSKLKIETDLGNKLDTFRTDTVKIDTLKGIKPVKALATFPYTIWEILLPLVLIIFSIALIFFIWWQIKKRNGKTFLFSKTRTALSIAEESLAHLEARFHIINSPNDQRLYYEGLVDILRIYLGRRFNIHGTFKTSRQILEELNKFTTSHDTLDSTRHFLEVADRLKFSGLEKSSITGSEKEKFTSLLKKLEVTTINSTAHV